MQSDNTSDLSILCPSFNTYSSSAILAARISRELNDAVEVNDTADDNVMIRPEKQNDDEEFEFSLLRDEGFESFPIFDRTLLREDGEDHPAASSSSSVQISLRKLFINEERDVASSSDDEDDELEGASPGTYCVWKPKSPSPAASPGRCEKSKSTGSRSKRWRLRDLLLRRSNSDGKDSFVFLTPPASTSRAAAKPVAGKSKGKAKGVGGEQMLYRKKNRDGDKRKSYLPYRQDLVGVGFFR